MRPFLPLYYFPTTLYLVDDDPVFLETFEVNLTRPAHMKGYTQPQDFSAAVKTAFDAGQQLLKPYLRAVQESLAQREKSEVQPILSKILSSDTRFKAVAVVTIDYAMPHLTGLDTAKLLPSTIRKIMLTGEADAKIGVPALNEQLIYFFIRKDQEGCGKEVDRTFYEVSFDFFYEELQATTLKAWLPAYFFAAGFKEAFIELWKKHGGVEFYLLNNKLDFLCLNAEGKAFILHVRDKKEASAPQPLQKLAISHPEGKNTEVYYALSESVGDFKNICSLKSFQQAAV